MRSLLSMVSVLVLGALAAGCGTGSAGDQEDPATSSNEPSTEAPAPEAPAEVNIAVPDGFELDSEGGAQYILSYPSSDVLYRPLEDPESTHRIYVVSYLLPEEYADSGPEEREALVDEYDELSANTAAPSEASPALTGGYEGIYRYAEVLDWWEESVEQHNFFAFDGRLMVQVICQWKDDPGGLLEACHEAVADLELTTPGEGGEE
ncbi:hypothetical protein [Glycomyces xiaoerkulensis]|uniref:hypothetical protein n=1 Tax=Glycomyces xiaoerkulensis TaxID=2038139 RepID=UPI000C25FB66|nr:hypothetical protein [Glycomyces xiaoerkulensis]